MWFVEVFLRFVRLSTEVDVDKEAMQLK